MNVSDDGVKDDSAADDARMDAAVKNFVAGYRKIVKAEMTEGLSEVVAEVLQEDIPDDPEESKE